MRLVGLSAGTGKASSPFSWKRESLTSYLLDDFMSDLRYRVRFIFPPCEYMCMSPAPFVEKTFLFLSYYIGISVVFFPDTGWVSPSAGQF